MSILDQFCCICVRNSFQLININKADKSHITYMHKLSICIPNQLWKEEFRLCSDCTQKLESTYEFIQTCLISEKLRRELIENVEENIKKELVDPLQCNICNRIFKLKRSLKLHITRIHSKNNLEKVPSTKEQIKEEVLQNSEDTIENHMIPIISSDREDELEVKTINQETNGNPDNPEGENFCDDADNNSDGFNYSSEDLEVKRESKKRVNRRKNPLTCEYCGKLFYRRQHYSGHIRAKHTFEKPYKCDLCDARYTNSHSLLVHKRNHNNEKPFVCSYCGKSFVCSGDLYHHSKIHLNKREYKCTMCDKSFNTASILRTHKICMHTTPKDWKYICTYCSKRFPIHSSLTTHMKRHIGLREVSCHICNKKFFDKSELTKHFRSHSSECLFKCTICKDKAYKNLYALRKHMKIIHDVGTMKIVKPEKKFSCTLCPKVFTFNNKLKKHMCTHTGEKPFKCHICNKGFVDNYYRKVHLKKKHNLEVSEGT